MHKLPTDNRRPALLLLALSILTAAVLALTVTLAIQYQAQDRGYTTELRGALRKYSGVASVPAASIAWIGRMHGREPDQVRMDLVSAAKDPSAFDFDAPLHQEAGYFVQLFIDLGFWELWFGLTCIGVALIGPVILLVNKRAQPPRRPRGESPMNWS